MKASIATTGLILSMLAMPVLADNAQANRMPADRDAAGTVRENLDDAAITAKVNAEFAKDDQVSAIGINVDTDNNGHVTLRGDVKSKAVADRAIALARNVDGVASVTSNLTVEQ